MDLFVLMHPDVESGWIYLDRDDAKKAIQFLREKYPGADLDELSIKIFKTKDSKLISAIGTSYPEYLL